LEFAFLRKYREDEKGCRSRPSRGFGNLIMFIIPETVFD